MVTLMAHQRRAVDISRTHPRYALYWKPGCGKTIAMYAMIVEAIAAGFTGKVLVLAPKSILHTAWLGDSRHFPSLRTSVVWADSPSKRKKQIEADSDVFITNPESFKKHAADFISAGIRWLVIDESSKVKAHDTAITKQCIWFAAQMERVNLLSGTPAPNGEHEYLPQLFILNHKLFRSTNFWREATLYFYPVKRTIQGKARIIGWRLQPTKQQEFLGLLQQCSWALSREECIDLPGEQDILRMVKLSEPEANAYTSMVQQLRVELAGEVYNARAAAKLMKLRQLSSGILYTGESVEVVGNSKLDALDELLDELAGEQAVIWAEFTAEINTITELLASRGATFARIDGSTELNARTAAIEKFQASQLQYLVCHPMAAGHGVTLTAAANDIFYSLSYSYETHEQARARIYRKGQTRKAAHYYLLAQGTVDELVLGSLRGKRDAAEAVMGYLRTHPTRKESLNDRDGAGTPGRSTHLSINLLPSG